MYVSLTSEIFELPALNLVGPLRWRLITSQQASRDFFQTNVEAAEQMWTVSFNKCGQGNNLSTVTSSVHAMWAAKEVLIHC